jgi:putative SOS response-associated peptidase YedK
VRWQIGRADQGLFAVAGLWESWRDPQDGTLLHSFTLLTVNADGHALMGRMHRPGEEKRMPVLIAEQDYRGWLGATPHSAAHWLQAWPADDMVGRAAPRLATRDSHPQDEAGSVGPARGQSFPLF